LKVEISATKWGVHMDVTSIIDKLKQQDEAALEQIIQIYTPYVSTIIYNVSRSSLNTEDIEEICADVFITLWKNTDKIKAETFKGYLAAIAKSRAKDKLRSSKNTNTTDIDDIELRDEYSLADTIDNSELSRELRDCVEKLGQPDSEIVLRYYYYYQTSKTISEIMNMNADTVKTKLRRAKTKLRAMLEERGFH